jgi:hypothetical protein
MKITAIPALAVLACAACFNAAPTARAASNADNARNVAEHLDVLSFPSSIYPRRRPGANTLKDYGFVHFENADGGVRSIDPEIQWVFGVKIIEDNGGIKVLCIQDQAVNGGSYYTQNTVEVKLGRDGLFHGTGRTPENDQCPPFHK